MAFAFLDRLFKKPDNWKPVRHTVIKDVQLTERIHTDGYQVVDFLSENELAKLVELHKQLHHIKDDRGGMFYSLYSQDLDYRLKVHEDIQAVLQPVFDRWFVDYKNVINTFIVKMPGPKSEFNIHQDMTAMDETIHSPLSIWIPLQDIDEKNGALCIIPRSHHLFSPYRGISFDTPFKDLFDVMAKYLRPIFLKAGQAIIFDPRMIHNSLPNQSNSERVAIVSGIFPKDADIVTCYKNTAQPGSKIELLLQPDNFLLINKNFYQNCTDRPETGSLLRYGAPEMPNMKAEKFLEMCREHGIDPAPEQLQFQNIVCNMIGEPVVDHH